MKKILSHLFMLLIAKISFAQTCNDDIIMNVKGSWKKAPDFHVDPRAISRIDKMQQLLRAAYPQPKGMEAKWYRSGPEYPEKKGPVAFELRAKFFSYYCNRNVNKLLLDAGNADFDIWANHLGSLAEKNDMFLIQNTPVYLLKKKTKDFKGFPVYEEIFTNNAGNSGTIMLMMTRQGQLPYLPVTKKQYLLAFIAVQKKVFAAIGNNSRLDEICKPAIDMLATASETELAKPAYFKDISYDGEFTSFANEKDGRELVILNSGYFNSKLPDYVPQFIIVLWAWKNETPCHYLINQLEANFNFNSLQQMIDK